MRPAPTALAAGLLAAIGFLMAATTAHAHATLLASDPEDGAVLSSSPPRLRLTFNEPVAPLVTRLVDPAGTTSVVEAAADGNAVSVALDRRLGAGTHALSWRVVSLDGHPVGGTLVFSVGMPSSSPAMAAPSRGDRLVVGATWTLKLLLFVGLLVGVGGSVYLAWIAAESDRAGRRAIVSALGVGLLATPLLVGVQGVDALGLPLSDIGDPAVWKAGASTTFGMTAAFAAMALVSGWIAAMAPTVRSSRAWASVALVATGLAPALSGHASSASPHWLTRPAVFLHVATVAFWVGALLPLGLATARQRSPIPSLARFTRAIPWAIAPLVISGTTLSVVQVEQPASLLATPYGQILSAKLVLVALLLGLGAWNRLRLTPAVLAGAADDRSRLARSIAVEIGIAVLILGLVAGWRFTPPPRALLAGGPKPIHLHIHAGKAMADLTFRPEKGGAMATTIALADGDFAELAAKEVSLSVEDPSAGIEPITRTARRDGDGTWRTDMPLPGTGPWLVRVEILVTDFDKITLEDRLARPAP